MRNNRHIKYMSSIQLSRKASIARLELEIGSLIMLLGGISGMYWISSNPIISLAAGLVLFGCFLALMLHGENSKTPTPYLSKKLRSLIKQHPTIEMFADLALLTILSASFILFPFTALIALGLGLVWVYLTSFSQDISAVSKYRKPSNSC